MKPDDIQIFRGEEQIFSLPPGNYRIENSGESCGLLVMRLSPPHEPDGTVDAAVRAKMQAAGYDSADTKKGMALVSLSDTSEGREAFLERQLTTMREARTSALRHNDFLTDRLKECEAVGIKRGQDLDAMGHNYEERGLEIQKLRDDNRIKAQALTARNDEIGKLQSRNSSLTYQLEQSNAANMDLAKRLDTVKDTMAREKTSYEYLAMQHAERGSVIHDLRSDMKVTNAKLEELNKIIETLRAERVPLTAAVLADALQAFWNPTLHAEQLGAQPGSAIADGIAAVAQRLQEHSIAQHHIAPPHIAEGFDKTPC